MKSYLGLIFTLFIINTDLFAAEAGMPQLDPTYWASQAFWLVLVFTNFIYRNIKSLFT